MQEYAKYTRKAACALAVVSACLLCLLCFTPAAHAHALMNTARQSTESTHATTSSAVTVLHVTIIVLDMSGSMATNDPNGLRCSAASAFIALSGPGDFIGVVGLDNKNGEKNGPFISSLVWAQPTEMATLAERQSLQQTIMTDSNNCQPDNTTPTYDALQQALKMLLTASQNAQIDGSVILLTDGTPDPDTVAQINAINADLLPQFKQHHWPIDTIALGQDGPIDGLNGQTFHSFLSGVADATSGKFYDDGHGEVEGISPLNIAPFFVDIFALRIGRTVNQDIPPQQLNGATSRQNFVVSNYTDSLDIVVVKDQPDIDVSLTTPGGQPITQSGAAPEPLRSTGRFWHDRRARPTHYLIGAGAEPEERRRALWDYCQAQLTPVRAGAA